jgi:uncharacterized protein (TIGR03083 family)
MMNDRPVIGQLEATWGSIAEVCRDLSPGEWVRQTDCPGWTVLDQLSHMIGTESTLAGRPAPPAAPGGLAHVHNPIGEMNEAWVRARRARPPQQVLAEFEQLTAERLTALRSMSEAEFEAATPSPIGAVPYATFMQVRVMDCWVHEQDIRRAVGRPGHLAGPAAETALGRLTSSVGYVVGKRVAPPDGTTVVIELTGPMARTLAIVMRDGRAVSANPTGEVTARIEMDTETFTCLACGRWSADQVLREARARFGGDEHLGATVVHNLATMP